MTDRQHWSRRIEQLDPATDHQEIYRILVAHEFPWDMNQALSLALFRTYAVPSIGRLLFDTGEFTERVQKRYEDTGLLLDAVLEHGLGSPTGRTAVRRINQMHGAYDISADDLRYVLCTFVVTPIRWLDAHGWRRLTERERVASANYYRELGRHMAIPDIPRTHQEFTEVLDAYERAHFAYDEGGRAVADATLALMTTLPPNHLLPAAVSRRSAYALMDPPLLQVFGYPEPTRAERLTARALLRARALFLRTRPPRLQPRHARDLPSIRGYPDGYKVGELGTFPRGCPVRERS